MLLGGNGPLKPLSSARSLITVSRAYHMPNDPTDYPEDSFENMQKAAERMITPFSLSHR